MLLWPVAVALTAYPPFRDAHMPAAGEPAQAAPRGEAAVAGAAPGPPSDAEREPAAQQQAQQAPDELEEKAATEEHAQEAPAAGDKKKD